MLEKAVVGKASRDVENKHVPATVLNSMESAALALEEFPVTQAKDELEAAVDVLTALAEPIIPRDPTPPPPPPPVVAPRPAIKLKINGFGGSKSSDKSDHAKSRSPSVVVAPVQNGKSSEPKSTSTPNGIKLKPSKSKLASLPEAPAKKVAEIAALPRKPSPIPARRKADPDFDLDDLLGQEVDIIEATRQTPAKKKERSRTDDDVDPPVRPPKSTPTLPPKDKVKGKEKVTNGSAGPSRHGTPTVMRPPLPPKKHSSMTSNSLKNGDAGPSPAPSVRIKLKSKESKEVKESPPISHSSSPHKSIPFDSSKCMGIIRTLRKAPNAILFLLPVDAVALGCPE